MRQALRRRRPGSSEPGLRRLLEPALLHANWRIPFATDAPLTDVSATVTLPAEVAGADVTFDAISSNAAMPRWGQPYSDYTWTADAAAATDNGDGTWTVDLPDMAPSTGTVFQFFVHLDAGLDLNQPYVASAVLTAESAAGECGYDESELPLPEPTSNLGVCQAEHLGRTIWNVYDRDITDREKYHDGEESDDEGEVNADGWGATGWTAGSTSWMRLYGATAVALENARLEVEIVNGGSFVADDAPDVSTPAAGALQGNGYTEAVDGAGIAVTESAATGTIASMPEMSSYSFNVQVVRDGDNPIVLLHRLIGDRAGCDPVQPEPRVTTSEWTDGTASCESGEVEQTRTETTVAYAFDDESAQWVESEPTVVTETRTRPLTAEEQAACDDDVTETPGTEEPTPEDSDDRRPTRRTRRTTSCRRRTTSSR